MTQKPMPIRPYTQPTPMPLIRNWRRRAELSMEPLRALAGLGGAEIRLEHGRIAGHRLGRPLGDLAAEIEHNDPPRDPHDEAHVVLDQEDRDAAPVDRADDLRQPTSLGHAEPAPPSVNQPHARP